ncbi:MAG: hypothetical protein PHC64_04955 [Candidatus Gastranaerophilales bacterium]|nr:hypothetical protein [Candidatus Gastranaerophilales bacterium]
MKLFEKKDTIINIEEDDLKDAKLSSVDFTDAKTKKRAFINVLGARLAMKMLFSQKIEVNNLYSLYTIHNVLEELDIADIYYEGIKMDVRLIFNRDEIFIPKSHFENDLLPDLYIVLELNKDFSSAEFLGFFEPKILNTQNQNKDFYFHEYNRLISPKELKTFLNEFKPESHFEIIEDNIEEVQPLFLSLSDKDISEQDKQFLFKQLSKNLALREKMVEFENFEMLSKQAVKDKRVLKDSVLDIVGSQELFKDEGIGSKAEIQADVHEEVLSDLLDEALTEETGNRKQKTEEEDNDFFKELSSAQSPDKEKTGDDFSGMIAGAAAGAVAGTVAGAAAGAVGEVVSQQTNLAETAADVISAGTDLIGNVVESTDKKGNSIKKEEKVIEFADLQNILPDEGFFELPELENFGNLEDIMENKPADEKLTDIEAIKPQKEKPEEKQEFSEEVIDLDDFDFDMLNGKDNQEKIQESVVSFEEIKEHAEVETEKIETEIETTKEEEIEIIEEEEEEKEEEEIKSDIIIDEEEETGTRKQETEEEIEENSEDLISQVNEFLDEVDLPEENTILENAQEQILQEQPTEEIPAASDKKDMLQVLFNKTKRTKDISDLPVSEVPLDGKKGFTASLSGKDKKLLLITASVASVVLASVIIGNIVANKNEQPQDINQAQVTAQGQAPINLPPGTPTDANTLQQDVDRETNLIEQQINPTDGAQQDNAIKRDMSKAVSDAFSSEPVNASISKVAWEVPEDLAYNDSFRKYLQTAGKNIKLNLQNDLLLATELAYSNKVIVDLAINADGSLQTSNITVSSGSKQIDKIVLQSVKETLQYLKMPSNELGGNSANVTLIINF